MNLTRSLLIRYTRPTPYDLNTLSYNTFPIVCQIFDNLEAKSHGTYIQHRL